MITFTANSSEPGVINIEAMVKDGCKAILLRKLDILTIEETEK